MLQEEVLPVVESVVNVISDEDLALKLNKKYVYSEKNIEALMVAFNTKSNIIFFGPGE